MLMTEQPLESSCSSLLVWEVQLSPNSRDTKPAQIIFILIFKYLKYDKWCIKYSNVLMSDSAKHHSPTKLLLFAYQVFPSL